MDALRQSGTSLILVSHNMDAVRRVCERGLVMYRGEAIFEGSSAEAVIAYSDALREAARKTQVSVPKEEGIAQRVMTFDAEIEHVLLKSSAGQPITVIESGEPASIVLKARVVRDIQSPVFSLMIRTTDGRVIYDTTTRWQSIQTPDFVKGDQIEVEFKLDFCLLEGEYEIGVDIASTDFSHFYDSLERAMSFSVIDNGVAKGLANLNAEIHIANPTN